MTIDRYRYPNLRALNFVISGLLQEGVGLGERGGRTEPLEDLAGVVQDGRGLGTGKPEETPALAQECERLLGDDPEPLPAIQRHRQRQDDPPRRAQRVHPRGGAPRHDRGRHRTPPR